MSGEELPPERLRRFDPGDWCPPETGFFGGEGHLVWRRAHGRYERARAEWCRAHGITVRELVERLRSQDGS